MDKKLSPEKIHEKMDKSLTQYLFEQREEKFVHDTPNEEFSLFTPVVEGDIKSLKKALAKHRKKKYSKISDSPLQQRKFLYVSIITTCCRLCIEAGMSTDESYGLSDLYILKMDKCTTEDEVMDMTDAMLLDYAERMHSYRVNENHLSPKVIQCISYIETHLHDRITVQKLADEFEMNASWLSTVFAKEVGVSVSEFIKKKKN